MAHAEDRERVQRLLGRHLIEKDRRVAVRSGQLPPIRTNQPSTKAGTDNKKK